MANKDPLPHARSWLFAPGDSEKKMLKATAGPADIVLLDLEDAVAEEEKGAARARVARFLASQPESDRRRLWVRINPLDGPHALADLAAVIPALPGGIMLPKSGGREDVERLDNYLSALEVSAGVSRGATPVIALVTETAQAMFTTGGYRGAPRLVAMTWGAEDLAAAVGASGNRKDDGAYGFTYELARSLCLLGASAAAVAPIESIHGDFHDTDGLRKRAETARREGYRGMLAIHPDQVGIINDAFMPEAGEIAIAQAIVDLFAANPGVGAIAYGDTMLDRPHLARAQALLAMVAATAG